jgi:hypothetical protein
VGSDLARLSYDRTRGYRSVIVQQGRVTLEADANEAAKLASEALRHETIDIVGPAGTPDQGYTVSAGSGGPTDIVCGAGIMYLGGWRLHQDEQVHLNNQPDWLNLAPGQPDWKNLPVTTQTRGNLLIALLATEQSVSAVEDNALREVALGGPDTAARSRLMQHFLAIPVVADTCAEAAKELVADLGFNGLTLDTKTCAVTCGVTLQVSFFPPPTPADPCSPTAAGGYLGADNQLVRVTIASYDQNKQTGTLLWGWNNASTLYRASVAVQQTATQPATLTLSPAPVDAAHTPQQGQAIEILRTECVLSNNTAPNFTDQNYIAARQGQVMILPLTTGSFSPDLNTLMLPAILPTDYASEPNTLFVRLWQAEVPFVSGQSVQLDDVSGLAVTVTVTTPASALPSEAFASATPYWQFAVRPNTPEQVYPVRYLEAAQLPDGPRQWLCDLAVVSATANGFKLLEDCRQHFIPLIDQEQSACCGVVLGPTDVTAAGGLQAVVTKAAAQKTTVSLLPGTYQLPAPLALTRAHTGLTLQGCCGGVMLVADPNALSAFRPGLITITQASDIRLLDLTLTVPQVPLSVPGATDGAAAVSVATMCGIRLTTATDVTIGDCIFDAAVSATTNAIAACVFAEGACSGLALRRNQFNGGRTGTPPANIIRFTAGLWQSPTATGKVTTTGTDFNIASATYQSVNQQLEDSQIIDNVFTGLTIGVLVIARLGLVRCANNRVRNCCGGLWFVEAALGTNVAAGRRALTDEVANNANANLALNLREGSQPVVLANAVTYTGLLEPTAPAPPPPLSTDARQVLETSFTTRGETAYTQLTNALATTAPLTSGPAATVTGGTTASPAAARIAFTADTALLQRTTAAYDQLANMAVAVEQVAVSLQPTLYLVENDLQLVPATAATTTTAAGTVGATPASLPGLLVACTQGGVQGNIFIQGNRVEVPTNGSIATVSFWAARTTVTGNQFYQLSADSKPVTACAIVVTDNANLLAIMGNIVHTGWVVYPPRGKIPIDTWEYLNTIG